MTSPLRKLIDHWLYRRSNKAWQRFTKEEIKRNGPLKGTNGESEGK